MITSIVSIVLYDLKTPLTALPVGHLTCILVRQLLDWLFSSLEIADQLLLSSQLCLSFGFPSAISTNE